MMSTRPQFKPASVITSGDMSQSSITGSVTVLSQLSMVSYSFSWSGTSPVGTIKIQFSNDYSQNANGSVKNAGTWNDATVNLAGVLVSSIPVTGNTGTGFVDLEETATYAIRPIYTKTSGIGTLQAVVNCRVM